MKEDKITIQNIKPGLIEKAKTFPNCPGIYKFMSNNRIVYIGKSKNLRTRVLSYFRPKHERDKLYVMMSYVDDIVFEAKDTHLEARILEYQQIRHYQPMYNAQFKIAKTLYFLDINEKDIIKISDKGEIGPFLGQRFIRNFKDQIENSFPIIIDGSEINFEYNILAKRLNKKEKYQTYKSLKLLFEDINMLDKLIEILKAKMLDAAKTLKFEQASYFKSIIDSLEYIRKSLIDKLEFFSKTWVYLEDDNYLLIKDGMICFKSNTFDKKIFEYYASKDCDSQYSFELKSLVYGHVKEKVNVDRLKMLND